MQTQAVKADQDNDSIALGRFHQQSRSERGGVTCRRSKHEARDNSRGRILAILLVETLNPSGWPAVRSGHSHATYEMSLDPMIEFFFPSFCLSDNPGRKAARGAAQRSCRGDHCLWPKMPERGNHGDDPDVERPRPSLMIDFAGCCHWAASDMARFNGKWADGRNLEKQKHERIGKPLAIDCQL